MSLLRNVMLAAGLLVAHPAAASVESDLEAIILSHYERSDGNPIPGMLVGVWEGETSLVQMSLGAGNLDLDASGQPGLPIPITFNDRMRIASLTKTFTITRILQMAAEGYFTLDTRLVDLDTGGAVDFTGLNFRHGSDTTLRHLANMTSGVADYSRNAALLEEMVQDLTAPWAPATLVDYARNQPAAATPWEYSNTNTVLLGMIIEAMSGNSLAEELETHIFGPAGLSLATEYPSGVAIAGPHARGYAGETNGPWEDVTDVHPSVAGASGGMISSFEDLHQWARILATGELPGGGSLFADDGFLQEQRLLLTPTEEGAGPFYDAYGLGIGSITGWLGHTGEFFGYQHLIMYDEASARTIVIMMNRAGFPLHDHVPTELFQDMALYFAAVPEPSALWLLGVGAAGLTGWRLRRQKGARARRGAARGLISRRGKTPAAPRR